MGEDAKAREAVERLVSDQMENGSFGKSKTSITRSSGKSLNVETTSLALLSMMRIDFSKYTTQIKKGIGYLMGQMNRGYFGSTQATILAMRTLIEYMTISNSSCGEKQFDVSLNGDKKILQVGDQMKNPEKSEF
jgi:hypothetical protein